MTKPPIKKSITLEYHPMHQYYIITQLINLTSPKVGEELNIADVDNLIAQGIKVVTKPIK